MTTFGFCTPIFAGVGGAHPRTPLLDRVDYDEVEATVQAAEALGYDSAWVADHLILGRDGFILEGWTVMAALARVTRRMRLGSIHYANLFRPPSMTAKMAATLDFISGGRLDFFFDPYAGQRADSGAYGLADDGSAIARFEEALELIKRMWSEDKPSYRGKYYRIEDAICLPRPIQKPSIPIWIGTSGNATPESRRKISEIMSRHADWWNITPASIETMREARCARPWVPFAMRAPPTAGTTGPFASRSRRRSSSSSRPRISSAGGNASRPPIPAMAIGRSSASGS
jgi:alkanesulfonate monooxygenase SsuD/methylene tetrahydromethanopterin reductase-like flavin-dependent oxidoreductase (luciferase family)